MITIQRPESRNINAKSSVNRYQTYLTRSSSQSEDSIKAKFEDFMSRILTNEIQNRTAYDIAGQLIGVSTVGFDIRFELTKEEHEIVFVAENDKAQNILVLDQDGDIMISHSPFKGEGWRDFIDHNTIDLESVSYKFLSL